jgi:hypothetical protein
VKAFFEAATINVLLGDNSYDESGISSSWSQFTGYIITTLKKGFDNYIRRYDIIQNPDFFSSISTRTYSTIKQFYYDTVIKDFNTINKDYLNIYEVTIYLDPYILQETYWRKNIFEIIAQCGAMFNVVSSMGMMFFWRYNRNKFYHLHPKWSKVNSYMTGRVDDDDDLDELNATQKKTLVEDENTRITRLAKKRTLIVGDEEFDLAANVDTPGHGLLEMQLNTPQFMRIVKRDGKKFSGVVSEDDDEYRIPVREDSKDNNKETKSKSGKKKDKGKP